MTGLHLVHDALQVLLQRLRIVGEVAIGFLVEELEAYTQAFEQLGQDDASHAVDAVDTNGEASLTNDIGINQSKVHDAVDVTLVETMVLQIFAQRVDIGILEILALSDGQHLGTIGSGKELALVVQELQCIPLTGVV